jgi:hypothetical protein
MRIRWVGHATCIEDIRNACKISVEKSEGNKLIGRYRHRWVGSIQKGHQRKSK